MLQKLIRADLMKSLVLCCGVVGGVFVLVHLITAAVMVFSDEGTSLMLSGILLPIAAGILTLVETIGHVMWSLPQAIQCSQTRRRALGLTMGRVGFDALCAMGLAAVLTLAERAFAPALWKFLSASQYLAYGTDGLLHAVPEPGLTSVDPLRAATLFIEDFFFGWQWFPIIVLGCLMVGLIIGAVIQRFGGRGGWLIWAGWMAVCFAPQMFPQWKYVAIDWLLPLIGVLLLAALLWSFWSLLHAVIKT